MRQPPVASSNPCRRSPASAFASAGQRRELVQPPVAAALQPFPRWHEPPGIADQPRLRDHRIDVDLAPDMRQLRSLEIAAELDFIADEPTSSDSKSTRPRFAQRRSHGSAAATPSEPLPDRLSTRWCFHRQHDGPLDSTASLAPEKIRTGPFSTTPLFDFRQVRAQTVRPPVSEHGILKCVPLDQTGRPTAAAIEHLPLQVGFRCSSSHPEGCNSLVHDEADQIPIQLQRFRHLARSRILTAADPGSPAGTG